MPLIPTLDPHGEQMVAAHLRPSRYHSPEEVVTRALETLAEKEPPTVSTRTMTPAEAVADIRELRKASRSAVSVSRISSTRGVSTNARFRCRCVGDAPVVL